MLSQLIEIIKLLIGILISYPIPERILSFTHLGESRREDRPILHVYDLRWLRSLMCAALLEEDPDTKSSEPTHNSSQQ